METLFTPSDTEECGNHIISCIPSHYDLFDSQVMCLALKELLTNVFDHLGDTV